ncbi:NAD(P)/FAD-dependent oxidoreductase [Halomonas denitrificans]|uniref:NAD(P)/FAD-dependent oxidoreductase n=1 Tax=Halomonas denitrificans TaxID=370769 RepID=UPI001C997343|nr:FAD-dependent oxidoreductase [Halomonas denitrificans]MBY5970250.1 FAD-dependent oxidoreductase [Halomonas denitrificans]
MMRRQVAIIGAGISGLACANRLTALGHRAVLFDKGRGPGGRAGSRRQGEQSLDLGAQHFTARHPDFQAAVDTWREADIVAPWPSMLYCVDHERQWHPHQDDETRYCGTPRMSALTRHLATGEELIPSTRITQLHERLDGWWLEDHHQDLHGPFDHVVVTAPAPQATPLLRPHDPALAAACSEIDMQPCWSAWVTFDAPLTLPGVDPGWPVARFDEGPIRLAIRHNTKPGRDEAAETVVLLATQRWSQQYLEDDASSIAQRLLDAFTDRLPAATALPDVTLGGAHRWRYANAVNCLGEEDHRIGDSGLVLAGDGCRGGRIEDAWLSGSHAAERLVSLVGAP